jgi:ATP-dependent Clp protease ATP-binding subunit ClpA
VLDEAGARARIGTMTRPPAIKELEARNRPHQPRKLAAIAEQNFEKAAALRDDEKNAKKNLEETLKTWRATSEETIVTVTDDDIMAVVSKWTGVPLRRMEEKETEKLLKMEDELKGRVIGQDEAVIAISKACAARAPTSRTRAARSVRSCSSAPPASARPTSPATSPNSCSAIRTRSSRSTCRNTWRNSPPAA